MVPVMNSIIYLCVRRGTRSLSLWHADDEAVALYKHRIDTLFLSTELICVLPHWKISVSVRTLIPGYLSAVQITSTFSCKVRLFLLFAVENDVFHTHVDHTSSLRACRVFLMASQAATRKVNLGIAEIASYVPGYHIYKVNWTSFRREVLQLRREPDNCANESAVAVMRMDTVVGHVPYNLATMFSQFLKWNFNKATVEVTGERVNHGAGYGLEVQYLANNGSMVPNHTRTRYVRLQTLFVLKVYCRAISIVNELDPGLYFNRNCIPICLNLCCKRTGECWYY